MGHSFGAVCNKCGTRYTRSSGGGFTFHLLHCETCGTGKNISFEELGDLHAAYLKGLGEPYSNFTRDSDKLARDNFAGAPITEETYDRKVEEYAGTCECGGHFRFAAHTRCPKCRSDEWHEDPRGTHKDYD